MATQSQLRSAQLSSQQASLRARNLQQQIKQQSIQKEQVQNTGVQDKVKKVIEDINSGKIEDYSQIPTDLRQYVDVDKSYFEKKKEYQQALVKAQGEQQKYTNLKLAEKFALKGLSAQYVKNLPKYARDYFAKVKQGVRSLTEPKQPTTVGYFIGDVGMSSTPELAPKEAVPKIVYQKTGVPLPSGVQYLNRNELEKIKPVVIKNNQLNQFLGGKNDTNVLIGKNDRVGFVSSVRDWIDNRVIGSRKDFEKGFKEESYQEGIGFVSASEPSGQATAYIRPPTKEEKEIIEKANFKGSYGEFPIVKFARGGYGWQQKVENRAEEIKQNQLKNTGLVGDVSLFFNKLPSENLENIPYSPQGFVPTATDLFFKGTNQITKGLNLLGVDTSKEVKIPKQTARDVALIGSLAIFDPLIRTGVLAKKAKLKPKGRFAELEEFFQGVRTEIVKKEAGTEQVKILNKIYEKFFKNKPNGKENFRTLVQKLYDEGSFKGIPAELYTQPQEKLTRILNIEGLPTLGGTSIISGAVSQFDIKPSSVREPLFFNVKENQKQTNILGLSNFNVVGNKQSNQNKVSLLGLQRAKTKQTQKPKQNVINKEIPKQIEILKSGQKTKTQQKTSQLTRQDLRQLLESRQTQRQRSIGKTQQKTKSKFPFGFEGVNKSKQKKTKDMFKVFLKRFGKDRLIFTGMDKAKAQQVLKKSLEFSLGRSGKILKNEKPLTLDFGGKFRKSKVDPFRIVQKRKFSLGTRSEVGEIQMFKKQKKK